MLEIENHSCLSPRLKLENNPHEVILDLVNKKRSLRPSDELYYFSSPLVKEKVYGSAKGSPLLAFEIY